MVFLFLIFSCSSRISPPSTILKFDPSLVRSYTFELEKLKPVEEPFFAEYKRGNKQLVVIAVDHLSAIKFPDLLKHPTLLAIEEIFTILKPEMSIVEGIGTGDEINPKSVLNKANECKKQNYQGDCGESFFVINKALETKTQYLSGEPTEAQILKSVQEHGLSTKDLVGFYLVRKIPQWKRQAKLNSTHLDKLATNQLERYRQRIDPQLHFSLYDFQSWYKSHMSAPSNYKEITNNDAAPHGGLNATFIQRISNRVTFSRDTTLLKKIETSLNNFNRVLVVYGGSHFINIEPALSKTLGKAEIKKSH